MLLLVSTTVVIRLYDIKYNTLKKKNILKTYEHYL